MPSDVLEIFSPALLGGYIGVCFIIVFVIIIILLNKKNTASFFPLRYKCSVCMRASPVLERVARSSVCSKAFQWRKSLNRI